MISYSFSMPIVSLVQVGHAIDASFVSSIRLITATSIILVLFTFSGTAQSSPQVDKVLCGAKWKDPSIRIISCSNYINAVDLGKNDLSNILTLRGSAYFLNGENTLAIRDLNEAVSMNAGNIDALTNRGNFYLLRDLPNKAILDFSKIIELKPNSRKIIFSRGLAHLKQGEINQAIIDLERALELGYRYPHTYFNRGVAYLHKGLFSNSLYDFHRAIERNPHQPEYYNFRAYAYEKLGNRKRAIIDFAEARRLGALTKPILK